MHDLDHRELPEGGYTYVLPFLSLTSEQKRKRKKQHHRDKKRD
jgi:hypothetical protein